MPSRLQKQPSIGELSERLSDALDEAGYSERHWYRFEGQKHAAALVTRIEQFESDGSTKKGPERFSPDFPATKLFPFQTYIKNTFVPMKGRWRLLVFVLAEDEFIQSKLAPTLTSLTDIGTGGSSSIPDDWYTQSALHLRLGVYVYEFQSSAADLPATFVTSDKSLPAKDHLVRSGIYTVLGL